MATTNLSDYKPLNISNADEYSIGIVVSEWNDFVTFNMRDGALEILNKEGIRKENIKALFVENISDPRLMQQISKETSVKPGQPLFSDALSDDKGPASTYLEMMRYNTAQILAALKQ